MRTPPKGVRWSVTSRPLWVGQDLSSSRHQKIRSVIDIQMGAHTGSDTCPIIEVALADAVEIIIDGLPSFSDGLMLVFSFE